MRIDEGEQSYCTDVVQESPHREATPDGLSVIGLSKSFGEHCVLDNVSLSVRPGEIVGLFGRDGAGKSVTFYTITGLLKPDSGRIALDGTDITGLPLYRRAILGLGYLPQEPSVFRGLTVAQNIRAVLEMTGADRDAIAARLEDLLRSFQLETLRDTKATALSGGERRRCEVARALALEPSVILLDEPFAGVDPLTVTSIKHLVRKMKERGIGVLISDQNVPEMLQLIERAYVIHEGSILFAGTRAEMLGDERVHSFYLGDDRRAAPTGRKEASRPGPPRRRSRSV